MIYCITININSVFNELIYIQKESADYVVLCSFYLLYINTETDT